MALLEIRNLSVEFQTGRGVFRAVDGLDLDVDQGDILGIVGESGSGKSVSMLAVMGLIPWPGRVTADRLVFNGRDLLAMSPEERAREGVFLAFQYPVELPGVNNTNFLRAAYNAARKHRGEPEIDALAFMKLLKQKAQGVKLSTDLLKRGVNEGFSGGEKKRNEILQMAVLEPRFAILDETDSGLDIDALKTVADGVNALRSKDRSMLVITHYQRLLDYIVPDVVHVLSGGRIVKSGGKELALELEKKGYGWVTEGAAVKA